MNIKFTTKDLPLHDCAICGRPIRGAEMYRIGQNFYHIGEFNLRFKKKTPIVKKAKKGKRSNKFFVALAVMVIIYVATLLCLPK